ncbi:DUF1707 domain-containing protein [Actinoplanes sp. LDG1-06]|uniref:DUF1707 domain-containing protein n=1 Tax=Paractinoplanes ovalisporus TaxID=2810368 RepID=A0ABS2A6S4_9ACTN|nr:DUF1707 domain-containing protein [Actinoplanes ovalisporus]MBM2615526.1 DUF1707 domain-containing protein [Actinoplanes ovalisporus]
MQPNDFSTSTKRLRTSDQEREHVAEILRAAMAEGRLDMTEGEERLAKVYASKFRDELAPLTADLPYGGLRALAETPDAKIATRRALRRHAWIIVSIGMILTGLWIISGAHFFWPAIPLIFLVMGFFRHARYRRYRYEYSLGHGVAPWNGPGWGDPRQFHSGRRGC